MKPILIGFLFCALVLTAGCGASGDGDNPLAKWDGRYEIFETFSNQTGNCVGTPSTTIYQGYLQVEIDGNAIDCEMDRYGHLKGEVRENGSIITNLSLSAGESASLSGSFSDDGTFTGNLRHIYDGCTRNWLVNGNLPTAGE